MKIACAPCCWGIENEANPNYPTWQRVIEDAKYAGFKGMELGPYGFFPTDAETLTAELEKADIKLVGGTVYKDLWVEDNSEIIDYTHKVCTLLKAANAPYVVIIDAVNDVRSKFSGLSEKAPRLDAKGRECLLKNIAEISKISRDYGLRPVLHNHAGGYIEFEDEIVMVMNAFSPEELGMCIDVGHIYYAGMDPVEKILEYKDVIEYVHFKDVKQDVFEKALKEEMGYFESCNEGVMCEIGKGALDYKSIIETLDKIGFEGYCCIEQERDPRTFELAKEDLKKSFEFCMQNIPN